MDKIADEVRSNSRIAHRQIEESVSRRTTGTSFEDSICCNLISSSLFGCIIKSSDCGLRTLRARLKVLRVFTLPVLKVVDTLDKCFVTLLEAHHKFTQRLNCIQLELVVNTKKIFTRIVNPEVANVEEEACSEFLDLCLWLKIDESWHIKNGIEVKVGLEEYVQGQMIHIGVRILILCHCLCPRPSSFQCPLVLNLKVIVEVLEHDVLGVCRSPDRGNAQFVILFDHVTLSSQG